MLPTFPLPDGSHLDFFAHRNAAKTLSTFRTSVSEYESSDLPFAAGKISMCLEIIVGSVKNHRDLDFEQCLS